MQEIVMGYRCSPHEVLCYFRIAGWNCPARDTELQEKTNYGARPALPSRARAWSSPPDQLRLDAGDVQVWLVSLNQPVATVNRFLQFAACQQAFFHGWTRKEAFIKAKGLGLSIALDQFDVTLAADEQAALLRTRSDESKAARWSSQEIDVGPDDVAAVAIEAEDWKLSRWCFDEVGWATM